MNITGVIDMLIALQVKHFIDDYYRCHRYAKILQLKVDTICKLIK